MSLWIIFIAVLTSIFVFLVIVSFDYRDARVIINTAETQTGKFLRKISKNKLNEDLSLLLEEQNGIRVLAFKIKSLEGLFLLRIILSLSFFLLIIISGFLLSKNLIWHSFFGAVVIFFIPSEIVKGKISFKRKKIQSELPDMIDILSSLIKAGLSLGEALNYISENYKCETGKLFRLARIKIIEGHNKIEAYHMVAKFSFCHDFKSLIKILMQAESIGNPVSRVLKDMSNVIRRNQMDLLKIQSERMESNLILIIFIFIFIPTIFLFLLPVIPQVKLLF
ncbi:MAG: type II secretion system F family protein [Actinomycetota bacterium]|nr:type II secretion system F family protein [Actinomycetota bacterium]